MHILRNQKIAILALLLIVTIGASIAFTPNATAHTPAWDIPTFAHIYVAINPIGVGQTTHIYLFLTPTYADTLMTNNYRFHNYKLTITAPDGEETTKTFETIRRHNLKPRLLIHTRPSWHIQLNLQFPRTKSQRLPIPSNLRFKNDTYLPSQHQQP